MNQVQLSGNLFLLAASQQVVAKSWKKNIKSKLHPY